MDLIARASVSMPLNIAEGFSRTSTKDYKRFLEMSIGSGFEIETQFIVAQRLRMITADELGDFLNRLSRLQRSIHALINT